MTDTAGRTEDEVEARQLLASPALFLHGMDFDAGTASLTPMTEESYARSVALDGRIEAAGAEHRIGLDALDRAAIAPRPGRRSLHFIFHKGYCGATLLSRLLGAVDELFALREPPPLDLLGREARRLGGAGALTPERWRWANTVNLQLMARSWRDEDYAVVTAPPSCNQIMPGLVGWTPQCRAILLYVEPEPFIAGLMREDRQAREAADMEALYYADFRAIVGDEAPALAEMGPARRAAMVWLAHGHAFRTMTADPAFEGRLLPVDFDLFLGAPAQALSQICAFLGKPVDATAAESLTGEAGMMGGPSGPGARRAELDSLRAAHRAEIDDALRWVAPWIDRLGF
jgi:hypothetical protein